MKILYVATERGAAEAAASTLRGIAQNVTLTWTETPAAALKWIQYNRDAGAVIVDADTQTPGCNALLEQIRHLGIGVPLAVIAPEHLRGLLLAFNGERDAALADERDRTWLLEARLGEIEEWRRQAHLLLTEERTGHDAALARTGRICTALQERLFELEAAARSADERHATQVATIEQLAGREAELRAEAAEAMAARTAVEHQLAEAAAAERQAHQHAAEALAEAGERCAAAENRLTLETAARTALEDRLAAAENARQVADQTHATELAALAAQFAEREAQHNASSARTSKICTGLQQRLLELEDAIRVADDRHTMDMAAAETARQHAAAQHATELTSLTDRLADLESQCDAVTVEKTAFERQLRDTAAALEDALRERIAQAAAASERLTLRESELGDALAAAVAARADVERRLVEAEADRERAQANADAALEEVRRERIAQAAAASERLTLRETELGASVSEATAARMALEVMLAAAEAAHHTERQRWQSELADVERRLAEAEADRERAQASADAALEEVRRERIAEAAAASERLTLRETELGASVSEATAARMALEVMLAAAESAHQIELQRWQSELAGAAATLARRETELDDALAAAAAARAAVERRLAEAEAERERAQARADAASVRLTLRETELGASVSEATAARMAVEAALAAAEAAHHTERQRWQSELAGAADTLAQRETELGEARAAAVAARAAVERRLAEAEAERERAQASADAALIAAADRHALDLARLQQEAEDLRRQLDTMRTHAAALRRDLERVPALERQLEESLHENRRQFERAPYGLCECTRDGAVTRVNHSLARLLGYRSGAELQRIGLGAAVFECADDLRLLLERAVETGKLQSVETLFKTCDSGRLNVRLHALSCDESIVVAVEDLTKLCAVEQRLREAHRMEAVGRVASEVAVTCDTLLRDVARGGQRWLAGLESDTPLRHQGELLLDDVTRAAGYLRQFVAYGNKAISSLEPVSVAHVLREMEPMLKRVLGSRIGLSLPKPARLFEVDVESETVQRIFVNVANSARERMTHGGRMKIDLATTVVDQRFLARHPEVRPGAHVLVKITEVQGALRGLLPVHFAIGRAAHPPFTPPESDKPGMDLGPLMALISDLRGHLWMAVEPGGNLTLEIRIPARTTDTETAAVPGSRGSRSRQIAKWFRP